MSENKPPLAPEVHQPDHFWEYLNSVASYTINLRNEINNACVFAINKNIIGFHTHPDILSKHIEIALGATKAFDNTLPSIQNEHAGKTGYAMDVDNLSEFLRIHELYVQQQAILMDVLQKQVTPILTMSDAAHAHAVAASAKDKLSDQVTPTEPPKQ